MTETREELIEEKRRIEAKLAAMRDAEVDEREAAFRKRMAKPPKSAPTGLVRVLQMGWAPLQKDLDTVRAFDAAFGYAFWDEADESDVRLVTDVKLNDSTLMWMHERFGYFLVSEEVEMEQTPNFDSDRLFGVIFDGENTRTVRLKRDLSVRGA